MREPDRKAAWAALFILAIIAAELAWLLFIGPAKGYPGYAAKCDSHCHEPWWQSGVFWTLFLSALLVAWNGMLWKATRDSAQIAKRALIELERAYVFAEIPEPGISTKGVAINQPYADFRTLTLRFFNVGRVPAFLTHLEWDAVGVPVTNFQRPTEDLPAPFDPATYTGRKIPTGVVVQERRRYSETLNLFTHFPTQTRWDVPFGRQAIWCHGFVRYRDALGSRYITGFCFLYDRLGGCFTQWGDERYNYSRRED